MFVIACDRCNWQAINHEVIEMCKWWYSYVIDSHWLSYILNHSDYM